MKKYVFKLNPLLRLRVLEEERIKTEIAKINKKLSDIDILIQRLHEEKKSIYDQQEELLSSSSPAKFIKDIPLALEGKKLEIEKAQNEKKLFQEKLKEKISELVDARAKVKVVEKLQEKDFEKFKKNQNKIEATKQEDLVQMNELNKKYER